MKRGRTIARGRLLDRFRHLLDARLGLIIAPPGFGKSTFCNQVLEMLGVASALVFVSGDLREPAAFTRAIIEAVRLKRPAFGRKALDALADNRADAGGLASLLSSELSSLREPLIVALDDYHALDRPEEQGDRHGNPHPIGELLSALFSNPELEHVHWLITSRTMPQLRLAKLARDELLVGADQDALAFDTDEVRLYLELARGTSVERNEAERLRSQTGGWATGVVLSESNPFGRAPSDPVGVYDFLEEEVLPSLPAALTTFAIRSAALEELRPGLCDFALNRADSAQQLAGLERRNLFISRVPSPDQEPRYRYHALFRDFLLSKQATTEKAAVQARAADYFESRQQWLTALNYYVNGSWTGCVATLLVAHGEDLVAEGHASRVREALEFAGVADPSEPAGTRLRILHAETLIRAAEPEEAEAVLESVATTDRGEQANIAILTARAAVLRGDFSRALAVVSAELERGGHAPVQLAYLHRLAGRSDWRLSHLDEAEFHDKIAIEQFRLAGRRVDEADAKSDLAIVHAIRGEHARADRYFSESIALLRKAHRADLLPYAMNNLASLRVDTCRYSDALLLLEEARTLGNSSGNAYVRAVVHQTMGEALLGLGNTPAALDALRTSAEAALQGDLIPHEQSARIWEAIALMGLGRIEEARAGLKLVSERPLAPNTTMLAVLADLRMAWLERGDEDVAQLGERLLRLGQEFGQVRFTRFAELFLIACHARAGRVEELKQAVGGEDELRHMEDAIANFPDVAEVALEAIESLPDHPLPKTRFWQHLKDRARLRRGGQPSVLAPRDHKRPLSLEVSVLQPTPKILVDGQAAANPFRGTIELLLYLVHFKEGGTADSIGAELWGDMPAVKLQKKFHTYLVRLRKALGAEAIQRDGASWPGRYWLNPEIQVGYDVRTLLETADATLALPPHSDQLDGIRAARALHAAPYWPSQLQPSLRRRSTEDLRERLSGRDTMEDAFDETEFAHEWALDIHHDVEEAYYHLTERELALTPRSDANGVCALRAILQDIREGTGIGLREALEAE